MGVWEREGEGERERERGERTPEGRERKGKRLSESETNNETFTQSNKEWGNKGLPFHPECFT